MRRVLLALAATLLLAPAADAAVDDLTLVSRVGLDGAPADGDSQLPSVSGDGRYITFATAATNLGAGPGTYLKDMTTGALTQLWNGTDGQARLSDSGGFVCWVQAGEVKIYTVATGAVRSIPDGVASWQVKRAPNFDPDFERRDCDVSDDGNRVAYATNVSHDAADTEPATSGPGISIAAVDVYVHDFAAATDTLVSRADGPAGADGDGYSVAPAITPDGRSVLFYGRAPDLSSENDDELSNVDLRDTTAGRTTWISRADGPAGGVGTRPSSGLGNETYGSVAAEMSDDATKVVFDSWQKGLDPASPTCACSGQVYVRDVVANTTRVAAVTRDPAGRRVISSANTNGPAISGDGSLIGFGSAFGGLDPLAVGNSGVENTYVRSAAADRTMLTARAEGILGEPADAFTFGQQLSTDGRFDVFVSDADNLVPDDHRGPPDVNGRPTGRDVFVRELDPARPLVADLPGPPPVGDPSLLSKFSLTALTPVETFPTPAATLALIKKTSTSLAVPAVSKAAVAAKARKPPVALRVKIGEYGRVTLVVERARPGRKVGKGHNLRCVAAAGPPRRPKLRCTRFTVVKKATFAAYEGTDTFRLREVLGSTKLRKGSYRVRAIDFDLGKRLGAGARRFTIG